MNDIPAIAAGGSITFVVLVGMYMLVQCCQRRKSKCIGHSGWCDTSIESSDGDSRKPAVIQVVSPTVTSPTVTTL